MGVEKCDSHNAIARSQVGKRTYDDLANCSGATRSLFPASLDNLAITTEDAPVRPLPGKKGGHIDELPTKRTHRLEAIPSCQKR